MKKFFKDLLIVTMVFLIIIPIIGVDKSFAESKTGKYTVINLCPENYKIFSYWTYRKQGRRSLDLFCAQHGASIDSWNNYSYYEVTWNEDAGIWASSARATDAYKKITWIKNNFWEKSNADSNKTYTNEQRYKILKTVDSTITQEEVNDVFSSANNKFLLYQTITWTYTNGSKSPYPQGLPSNVYKVYNAIINLTDKYYKEDFNGEIVINENKPIEQQEDGTYIWDITVQNGCLLPYESELKVDGNVYTEYTIQDDKLVISGIGIGEHNFEYSVTTYQVSSSSSIWKNSSKQNFIEITNTERRRKFNSITTEAGSKGYYKLNLEKVDADNNNQTVSETTFVVNGDKYTTDDYGFVEVIDEDNKIEITDNNQVFTYTISEVHTKEDLIKLKDPVEIELKTGSTTVDGNTIFYIRDAIFSANGEQTLEAFVENNELVTLEISVELVNDTSMVKVTIPNREKKYDLALTKSIVISTADLIDRYDFNRDGMVDSKDYSFFGATWDKDLSKPYVSIDYIRNNIKEGFPEAWNKYYRYISNQAIFEKYDLDGDEELTMMDELAANDIMNLYGSLSTAQVLDRHNYTNESILGEVGVTTADYNLNKTVLGVKADDVIIYKIGVYNEGDYDATNIEVTDFLPEELIPCDIEGNTTLDENNQITISYAGGEYKWTIDGKKASITLNEKSSEFKDGALVEEYKNIKLNKYKKGTLDCDYVYIACKIDKTKAVVGDILYNAAEITNSTPLDGDGNEIVGIKDRDSNENSLKNDNDITDKYRQRFEEYIGDEDSSSVGKANYNYEDDDDFERIVIEPERVFDLSLRKSITKVGKSEDSMNVVKHKEMHDEENFTEKTRLAEILSESVDVCQKFGTGLYYHPKEYVKINRKDFVEYTIRVYNEGGSKDYAGYAKQITDYLPSGLEFYAIVNKDGSWVTQETNGKYITESNQFGNYEAIYDKSNNKVLINCIDTPALSSSDYLKNVYVLNDGMDMGYYNNSADEFNDIRYAYQELKIICKISDSQSIGKIFTNIAEITDSVALNQDGDEDTTIKERDSTPGNVSMGATTKLNENIANLDTYYADRNIDDIYNGYYPGMEDDDDFETIYAEYGWYDLYMNKYGSDYEDKSEDNQQSGAKFSIKKYIDCSVKNDVSSAVSVDEDGIVDSGDVENFEYVLDDLGSTITKKGVRINKVDFDIGTEDVDYYDYYLITETESPTGYDIPKFFTDKFVDNSGVEHQCYLVLEIRKKMSEGMGDIHVGRGYIENNSIVYVGNEEQFNNGSVDLSYGDEKNIINVFISDFNYENNNSNENLEPRGFIRIQVEDPIQKSEKYKINLLKKGIDGAIIEGAIFHRNATLREGAESAVDYNIDLEETDSNGNSSVTAGMGDDGSDIVDVLSNDYEFSDKYTLSEVSVGTANSNKYYKFPQDINLEVKKKVENHTYTVDSVIMTIGTENVTLNIGDENTEKTLTVQTADESELPVTISVTNDENTGTITIDVVVTDPQKVEEGKYGINLVKVGTNGEQLEGVLFTAKSKINEAVSYTDIATKDNPIRTLKKGNVNVANEVEITDIEKVDEYVLNEYDIGDNSGYYIGITGDITLKVYKTKKETLDESLIEYIVNKIELSVDGGTVEEVSDTKAVVTVQEEGKGESKVTVELNVDTQTITITVENPKNEGDFKLNLIKSIKGETTLDGNPKPLPGAVFKITINDGTKNIYESPEKGLETDTDGYIPEITGLDITAGDLTYTITVEELSAPEGYIGLGKGNVRTFTAKSISDGKNYKLESQERAIIENDSNIAATVNPGEILIEVENRKEPEIHKGVKTVENQDSGYDKNETQTWVINSSIPAGGLEDYTKYVVTDEIDYEKTDVAEKRLTFTDEAHPENNVVVKYKGTDTVLQADTDYKVEFDEVKKVLTIIFIGEDKDGNEFNGGKALTEKSTIEITYNTKFALDGNGNIIGLNQSIPNQAHLTYNGNGKEETTKDSETPEVHTGEVRIYKYDTATNKALEGAHFKITRTKEEADKAVQALLANDEATLGAVKFVKEIDANGNETNKDLEAVTGADGKAKFQGLEFGEDAKNKVEATKHKVTGADVYEYDWSVAETDYYIVETSVPDGYILKDECIPVEVTPTEYDEVDLTGYHKVGNTPMIYEGEYNVKVIKYGKFEGEDPKPMPGVKFKANRTVNGLAKEELTLQDTDASGSTLVGNTVTIDKDKVSSTDIDTYVIKEESVPKDSEFYIGFDKEITLNITKQATESADGAKVTNSIKSIEMVINGENVIKVSDTKYTAKVTKDGQDLQIVAELVDNTVILTIENPHKVGEFDLNIIKYIKGTNPLQNLTGAGFKVSIKANGKALTDGEGNVLDGTCEYFVDGEGHLKIEGLNIEKAGITYAVEIEESTVPDGYIGIGGKITFNTVSKVYDSKLGFATYEETISNDVEISVNENEVWIDVENKPEPEIHKGVKNVENQDSGYDKDEIQTWVINSSIPAGIKDYTKYVITDEIDPEITNVEDKRIVFQGLHTINVKIKEKNALLIQNKDYVATFDDEKKIITITFIDGEFKAGQDLPEHTTLEITFATKFALEQYTDENGNIRERIKGLNQSIPNQAELIFNGNGKQEKKKKSEKPEIHTGGVGVFKFDDVNKNGKYDEGEKALEGAHFKVTRTKEEANKAVAIILKYEEEGKTKEDLDNALKDIKFVKERAKDGKETEKDVEVVTGKDGKAVIEGLEFGEDAIERIKQTTKDPVTEADVYTYKWNEAETTYYLVETETPYGYVPLEKAEEVIVKAQNYNNVDLTKYYEIANKQKIYDLSLRKFITQVENKIITDREPKVTLTEDFKDEENDEVTTAIYEHTKEPVVVQQGNIVTYTIRIYNEGPEDAYASIVRDDIPDGVEFVQYKEGDGSINDEYRWKLVDENEIEVTDASKAKYIITDYLSMEQGEVGNDGRNSNLLKKFDSKIMDKLDYRDVKVQFKVLEPNTSERILINYAQISKETDANGKIVEDRDSIPNVWNEGEDDQDIEKIKLLYFDLALRKWVTKAIVYENGQEYIFETGHKAEDDPEDVVKVDLKKSRLDKVVVKFEYQIRVTNQGKIGGWADEVTDHIPEGLKFEQADNPIWTPVDEHTIVTDYLKDVYLEPGESTEVTVVLTWINSGDNLGVKNNIAEISKDRNEYGVPDIDSIPGNYRWGEDDIDDAPVMLTVRTGSEIIGYVSIVLGFVAIMGLGVYEIKKRILV